MSSCIALPAPPGATLLPLGGDRHARTEPDLDLVLIPHLRELPILLALLRDRSWDVSARSCALGIDASTSGVSYHDPDCPELHSAAPRLALSVLVRGGPPPALAPCVHPGLVALQRELASHPRNRRPFAAIEVLIRSLVQLDTHALTPGVPTLISVCDAAFALALGGTPDESWGPWLRELHSLLHARLHARTTAGLALHWARYPALSASSFAELSSVAPERLARVFLGAGITHAHGDTCEARLVLAASLLEVAVGARPHWRVPGAILFPLPAAGFKAVRRQDLAGIPGRDLTRVPDLLPLAAALMRDDPDLGLPTAMRLARDLVR